VSVGAGAGTQQPPVTDTPPITPTDSTEDDGLRPMTELAEVAIEAAYDEYGEAVAQVIEVEVDIEALDGYNANRVIAITADGVILGGRLDAETGIFTFETDYAGDVTIVYVEDLVRVTLTIGSDVITDVIEDQAAIMMDVAPMIYEGYTLVPARFIAYAFGADIDWNGEISEVTITLPDGRYIRFIIGQQLPGMSTPAQIIEDRTMVPLRFIAEFFGAYVGWDADTQTIELIR